MEEPRKLCVCHATVPGVVVDAADVLKAGADATVLGADAAMLPVVAGMEAVSLNAKPPNIAAGKNCYKSVKQRRAIYAHMRDKGLGPRVGGGIEEEEEEEEEDIDDVLGARNVEEEEEAEEEEEEGYDVAQISDAEVEAQMRKLAMGTKLASRRPTGMACHICTCKDRKKPESMRHHEDLFCKCEKHNPQPKQQQKSVFVEFGNALLGASSQP